MREHATPRPQQLPTDLRGIAEIHGRSEPGLGGSLTDGERSARVPSGLRHSSFVSVAVVVAAAAAAAGAGGASALPIKQRVLPASDLKGFVAAPLYVSHSLTKAAARQPLGADALRSDGFVALGREALSATGVNDAALSATIQFKTAAGAAKAATAVKSANATTGPWTYFSVPGIPGAYGFMQSGSGGSGYNIVFADGAFEYLVGIGSSATTISTQTRALLITAAEALYKRVHGHPAA